MSNAISQPAVAEAPRAKSVQVAGIAGLGVALPDQVVTNAPIAERLGLDETWIVARTGVGQRLGLDPDRVIDCIARYGNTSAASIPIALAEAERSGRLHPGSRVLVSAFGAGFTWGSGVLEWGI